MDFEETLVPYEWDSSWIEEKVFEMIKLLNSEKLPESNPSCENCAYAHQRIITEKNTSHEKNNEDGKVYKRSKKCPECKSRNVTLIQYGYIVDPDAAERIEKGELVTGGCCIDEDSPKWQCRDCQNQFGKINMY